MRILKRILIGTVVVLLLFVSLFLIFIGPWPVYKDSRYAEASYYREALAAIDSDAALSHFTDTPEPLQAGWAQRIITPSVGLPIAGYGARKDGMRSQGVRDDLKVKAVSFHDGRDTVVLIGVDMLIIPPNIAELTVEKVAARSPLLSRNLYFSASHTHCGPGGFGPGIAAKITGGKYNPSVPEFLSSSFADAIVEAWQNMKPAKLAHGVVNARDYIRNRARDHGDVDPNLNYMVLEQENGRKCYVTRFSAHPTNFGSAMMKFSAEYPGAFMRSIEEQSNATAMYMGGGLGSMSGRGIEAANTDERIEVFGKTLADLVLADSAEAEFTDRVDIASLAVPVGVPPFQCRPLSPKWRLSPLSAKVVALPREGFVQGARIGDLLFVGLPFDTSGELTRLWREEKAGEGWDLWVTSFSRAYLGYLSPDKYYGETNARGQLDYEIGFMNWLGPNSAAYFKELVDRVVQQLGKSSPTLASAL
ncbi:MAG: hypothetical protein GX130_04130 [Candidatus Hydrogenedens sp.]|nr:hypothetical protein [Candidatus Hydrogenedens sp.]